MRFGLRGRIVAMLAPLFVILAALGGTGLALIDRIGGRIDAILRENYRSVTYMAQLNEALERIDSSFSFALGGRDDLARLQYDENWSRYLDNLKREEQNVTLPGEQDLVDRLRGITDSYHRAGDAFYALPAGSPARTSAYHGTGGLLEEFREIKTVSGQIHDINQQSMEQASDTARKTALTSLTFFGTGLAAAALIASFLAWRMIRSLLDPVHAVTQSATQISAGNLDQVVPIVSADELGQLAEAFNVMAHRLRDYRQSHTEQLLRAQRTSQATIDSFPDPVLVIDTEGEVEMANPAAGRMLGVVPKRDGQPGTGIWQPPDSLRAPLADALRGQRDFLPEDFGQVVLVGGRSVERAVLPRILTIRDPQHHTLGAAVLLQDVTRLRLLDQMKSNLVATASHELKTPLTSIRLAVHVLLQEAVGPLNAKQSELVLDARENCERLLATINNLLDLARLEQGSRQIEVHPESPRTLLTAAAESVAARARDANVTLSMNIANGVPAVLVDSTRIGHALRNLLDNALTYTDAGGTITLSAEGEGDFVVLSVSDTGCGIPADALPHVFEKFFRVAGQSRGGGTGLGLAIVQEIVAAHGGAVSCESEPGKGTTFRLRLPATKAPVDSGYVVGSVTESQGGAA